MRCPIRSGRPASREPSPDLRGLSLSALRTRRRRGVASGPGYDYLQCAVPFHDTFTGRVVNQDLVTISAPVSHLVSADSELAVPGSVDRDFGGVRIPRPDATEPPVCRWRGHAPVIVGDSMQRIMEQVDPDVPTPPANAGIRFIDR